MQHRRAHAELPRRCFALCAGALVALWAATSQADVTSWFYLGGGLVSSAWTPDATRQRGTLAMDLGMGSAPDKDLIVGGMFKTLALFGDGIDLGLAVRGATGGFVR